jgi:hypothetical protein
MQKPQPGERANLMLGLPPFVVFRGPFFRLWLALYRGTEGFMGGSQEGLNLFLDLHPGIHRKAGFGLFQ